MFDVEVHVISLYWRSSHIYMCLKVIVVLDGQVHNKIKTKKRSWLWHI